VLRQTKIIATLGPATDDPEVLYKLIEAGVDVVRLNFSHGDTEIQRRRAQSVRECAHAHKRHVGILVDLQGPKIRIGRFRDGSIDLQEGDNFILDAELPLDEGTQERVGITYKGLAEDVRRGTTLLLDDGRIVLWVDQVRGSEVCCRVVNGGELSNSKGINLQGGGLSAAVLGKKDETDIITAAKIEADYLGVSFIRSAADVNEARELFHGAGATGGVVAKIERVEAVDAIDEIIEAADAIMLARGDLGVEIGDAALPPIQKRIIKLTRECNKVAITATQMMESMIKSAIPTRAEVSDVANAVLDGTDAVMLSAETAIGNYPVAAVLAMDRVCRETEKQHETQWSRERRNLKFGRVDEAIAMAVMYSANHMPVRAIAALTESGATTLWMSRISSAVPIYAMTPHERTCRKVALFRGVYPASFVLTGTDPAQILKQAVDALRSLGAVREGDLVILTIGEPLKAPGGTNSMRIVRVGALPNKN
jgi:pyruvate kinase